MLKCHEGLLLLSHFSIDVLHGRMAERSSNSFSENEFTGTEDLRTCIDVQER
eukprot:m.34476 g.34476  ORF g.34476 m.34476 type:complete len:52 (+) comp9768_c1_seq1:2964-3119(+)